MTCKGISITIITVVYNDVSHIEKTINSVLDQDYPDIEFIVIDGGSTDGTVKQIEKYHSRVNVFLSQKDRGIYDAMNKGIAYTTGDYVIFINSGDTLKSATTISEIFTDLINDADLIYGDVEIEYPNSFYRVQKAKDLKSIFQGMIFSHQSLFVKADILRKIKFDLNYKLTADYKLVLTCFRSNYVFHYVDKVISTVSPGGVSDNNLNVIREYKAIVKEAGGSIANLMALEVTLLRISIGNYAKKALPKGIVRSIVKWKG